MAIEKAEKELIEYERRIERPKYAIKPIAPQTQDQPEQEEASGVVIAPMLLLPLPRSNAGPSLLAELLMNKFLYHLPFHRQIAMLKMVATMMQLRMQLLCIRCWDAARLPMRIPENG